MLPDGWRSAKVGAVCAIKNNLRFPLSADERARISGPYPYFGPTGVLDHIDHFRIDEEFALIGEDGDHFLKFRDRPMTLLFRGKANVNNHAHIVGDSADCLARWFHYWFMHRDLTAVLSRQGVGRYKLTKAGLEELNIWLPPIQEQSRISELLGTWDAAISTTEELLANSRAQKQALMHSLLSDRVRTHRGLGRLHRGRASEVFKPNSVRRNAGLPLLSVMQDVGVVPRESLGRKVVMPEGSTDGYRRVDPGDFVISLRAFEGGLEYSRFIGMVSPAYTVIKPHVQIVDDFYRHYFKSAEFIGRLSVAVIGIRDGKQISYQDFASLNIPRPPIREQERIARLLNAVEAVIGKNQAMLEKLRSENVALMQQLLSGKRRLRVPAFEAA